MATGRATPKNIDEYIAGLAPEVRAILEEVRLTVTKAAPDAQETISYNIPTFTLGGALVHFAAFKKPSGSFRLCEAMPRSRKPSRLMRERRAICGFPSTSRSPTHYRANCEA